ncbi:MAG: hypothetical protein H7A51_05935 [Akkermansiaceae bacterium]|nr:hypothetical protein [Akkermansiaceae bacterium]
MFIQQLLKVSRIAPLVLLLGAAAQADLNVSSANMTAHFDAADIHGDNGVSNPAHGGTVESWTNLVTNTSLNRDGSGGNPVFIAAGNGGINNLATVRLTDGATDRDLLFNNAMNVTAQTVFAVLTMNNSGTAYSTLLSNANHSLNIRQGDNLPEYFVGNSGDFVQDGSTGSIRVNGLAGRSVSYGQAHVLEVSRTSATTYSGLRIGDNVVNPGRRWEGDVAEIVIYDGPLSEADRLQVGAYLANKYNLNTDYNSPLARVPSPQDGAVDVPVDTGLGWTPPNTYSPTGYRVYFGTDPEVRNNPMTSVTTPSWTPGENLAWSTTYHWAVDALDGTTVNEGVTWSFTTEPDPSLPYDPLQDLARHNVVWNSPSTNSAGSMPLGNGDLGLNVWVESDGDLMLLLSKTDAWGDNGRLLKLGRVRISLSPNPFAAGQPFVQTLNLPNGEILITAGSEGSQVSFVIWADANHPAIHIQAEGDTPRDWQAKLELWRTSQRSLSGGEAESAYGARNGPTALVVEPDTVVSGQSEKLTWYHRNVHSVYPETLSVQSLYPSGGAPPDPLLGRTFGATLYASGGFSNSSDSILASDNARNNASFTIVAHTEVTPSAADWISSLDTKVAAVEASPPAQRYAAHTAWWHSFWNRHWLVVGTPGSGVVPGGDAFTVSQGYMLQRFVNACGGRGNSPIKFNGSIFTVDATSSYDPDFRKWGPCYWWQNTRLPYWSMPMAGDLDLMEPLFKMYLDALPLARERVQTYYGHAGAYFPETMYFWGTWNNENYGWDRTGKEVGRSDNAYIRWEWQGGIELLWMMLERYEMSPDADFATNTLVPLARDIIDLYDHRFPRDGDGKIRFTPSQALETYWEGCENPTPEVAGLTRLLAGLLDLPESLTTVALREQWSRLLGEMPAVPQRSRNGQQAISPAEVIGPKGNRESPELYPVFPYAIHHVGKPDLALADWTYQTRADQNPNGWGQDVIFAAMLGRSAEAKAAVTSRFATKHSGSRFPAMWGPNYDWIPDQDHGGVSMIALQKMLLIEDGERLLLFPGWPDSWDVKFRVHARGNTTIDGQLKDGGIVKLDVTPASRYKDVETYLGSIPPQAGTWEHWRLHTPGAGSSPTDNGDGDAYDDLMEYVFGGDPADPASPTGLNIGPSASGTVLHFDRPTGLLDVTYTLQVSTDLTPDSWTEAPISPTVTPLDDVHERVSYDLGDPAGNRFYRLLVELAESP